MAAERRLEIIQGDNKKTLRFQNDAENKCDVLGTSHLHQSIDTHLTDSIFAPRVTRQMSKTIIQLVPNVVQCP